VCNELEAYLIGFFYADGCVSKFESGAYRTFSITLSEKDQDYLQWIVDVINSDLHTTYTLRYVPSSKAYNLTVSRKEFISRLINLGITNNKTYEDSAFVFNNIPVNLKRHFIRGYFDGDGCISFYKKKNRCHVGIVSLNHQLISAIQEYVYNIFKFGTIRIDKKYSRYQICGNVSTKKFLDWLYKDSNYYMQRKYDKYLQIPPKQRRNIYKGVCKEKRSPNNIYNVSIYYDGQRHYIGMFHTVREAVEAYNVEAEKHGVEQQEYKGEELYYE
jgi:intein/homing endonuclease